jgi:hypothetical protein
MKQLPFLPTHYSKPLNFYQQLNNFREEKLQKGNEPLISVNGYSVKSAAKQVSFDE